MAALITGGAQRALPSTRAPRLECAGPAAHVHIEHCDIANIKKLIKLYGTSRFVLTIPQHPRRLHPSTLLSAATPPRAASKPGLPTSRRATTTTTGHRWQPAGSLPPPTEMRTAGRTYAKTVGNDHQRPRSATHGLVLVPPICGTGGLQSVLSPTRMPSHKWAGLTTHPIHIATLRHCDTKFTETP